MTKTVMQTTTDNKIQLSTVIGMLRDGVDLSGGVVGVME